MKKLLIFIVGVVIRRNNKIFNRDKAIAKTDIDRLHDVHEGKAWGRRVGKTMLFCHLVAGQIESSDMNIMILISYYHEINDYLRRMILQVFDEHEISYKVISQDKIIAEGKIIKFISMDREKEASGGYDFRNEWIKMAHDRERFEDTKLKHHWANYRWEKKYAV